MSNEETLDELELIRHLAQQARMLSEQTIHKYFRHSFRVLVNTGQRVAFGVELPLVDELEMGKCNIPWKLTKRSQIYNKPYPCNALKTSKRSRRYFCHFHEDFAIQNGLPIEAPKDDVTVVRKRKRDDVEIEQSNVINQPEGSPSKRSRIDQVQDVDDVPCEYVMGCNSEATFEGFCDHHQLIADNMDDFMDEPEEARDMLKHEIAIQRMRDYLNGRQGQSCVDHERVQVTRTLGKIMCDKLDQHIKAKGDSVLRCHMLWRITIRNRMARALGIGKPNWYSDYLNLDDIVDKSITQLYFDVNHQVKV